MHIRLTFRPEHDRHEGRLVGHEHARVPMLSNDRIKFLRYNKMDARLIVLHEPTGYEVLVHPYQVEEIK